MTIKLRRGDHLELAQVVCGSYPDPKPVFSGKRFFRYVDGVWCADNGGRGDVSASIWQTLKALAGSPVGDRSGGVLTVQAQTFDGTEKLVKRELQDDTFFDAARAGVGVRNGFLTIDPKTGQTALLAASPEHRATFQTPVAYDPTAQCPRLMAMLASMRLGPGDIAAIQEFFGVALFGLSTRLQKYLLLHGNGGNGRSSLTDVFRPLFEEPAALPPHQWGGFRLAQLADKRLNIVEEMPSKILLEETSSTIKAVVTGSPVTAERKGKDPFTFRNRAGQVLLPQDDMQTNDLSEGFWRRLHAVGFTHKLSKAEIVRDIGNEIGAAEAPGIFAWLVEGAKRALAAGCYTTPESHDRLLTAWRRDCDAVQVFLSEVFDLKASAEKLQAIPARALYRAFADPHNGWAAMTGHKGVPTETKFGKRVKALGIESRRSNGRKYALCPKPAAKSGFFDAPPGMALTGALWSTIAGAEEDDESAAA